MGFHHVGQAGLKHLAFGDPPTLASQNLGITGVSHCIQPHISIRFEFCSFHVDVNSLVLKRETQASQINFPFFIPKTVN